MPSLETPEGKEVHLALPESTIIESLTEFVNTLKGCASLSDLSFELRGVLFVVLNGRLTQRAKQLLRLCLEETTKHAGKLHASHDNRFMFEQLVRALEAKLQ